MRVLHVLPNAGEGGVQRNVALLAGAQRAAGHEVAVAGAPGPLQHVFGEPWFDVPTVTRNPATLVSSARACRTIIRKWRPDVVNGHTVRLAPVVSLATGAGRWPVAVISAHGMPHEAVAAGARALRASRLPVIAVGPGLAAALDQHGVACRMIPNGIPPAPQPADGPALRREWSIPAAAPLAVAVGRLVPQKNHPVAVRALVAAPDVFLVILGEGPLRAQLEDEAARLGVVDRLRLVGFRDDARAVMAAADVVVMPSVWEGFGVAALEALAAGTPLVVSAGFGFTEWLHDGVDSLFVPVDDPQALAGAVTRVLSDVALAARLETGGLVKAANYTVDSTASQHIQIYRALKEGRAMSGRDSMVEHPGVASHSGQEQ